MLKNKSWVNKKLLDSKSPDSSRQLHRLQHNDVKTLLAIVVSKVIVPFLYECVMIEHNAKNYPCDNRQVGENVMNVYYECEQVFIILQDSSNLDLANLDEITSRRRDNRLQHFRGFPIIVLSPRILLSQRKANKTRYDSGLYYWTLK